MNYIIRLEARGNKGKEEVLEAVRGLSPSVLDQRVRVSTVIDGIKIDEENTFLNASPCTSRNLGKQRNQRKQGNEGTLLYQV